MVATENARKSFWGHRGLPNVQKLREQLPLVQTWTGPRWTSRTSSISERLHAREGQCSLAGDPLPSEPYAPHCILGIRIAGQWVKFSAPCGLRLSATAGGQPDVHLQLVSLTVDREAPGDDMQRVPASERVLRLARHSCFLAAAQMLFPSSGSRLLRTLLASAASIHAAGALALALPVARSLLPSWHQLDSMLQKASQLAQPACIAAARMSSHLTELATAGAVLVLSQVLWQVVHAPSLQAMHAMLGLLAVATDYNRISRDAALGRIPAGAPLEAAWRRQHKVAAQRLCKHLGDLPDTPPFAGAMQLLGRCSVAVGLVVDGQCCKGHPYQLPGSTALSGGVASGAAAVPVSLAVHLGQPAKRRASQHTQRAAVTPPLPRRRPIAASETPVVAVELAGRQPLHAGTAQLDDGAEGSSASTPTADSPTASVRLTAAAELAAKAKAGARATPKPSISEIQPIGSFNEDNCSESSRISAAWSCDPSETPASSVPAMPSGSTVVPSASSTLPITASPTKSSVMSMPPAGPATHSLTLASGSSTAAAPTRSHKTVSPTKSGVKTTPPAQATTFEPGSNDTAGSTRTHATASPTNDSVKTTPAAGAATQSSTVAAGSNRAVGFTRTQYAASLTKTDVTGTPPTGAAAQSSTSASGSSIAAAPTTRSHLPVSTRTIGVDSASPAGAAAQSSTSLVSGSNIAAASTRTQLTASPAKSSVTSTSPARAAPPTSSPGNSIARGPAVAHAQPEPLPSAGAHTPAVPPIPDRSPVTEPSPSSSSTQQPSNSEEEVLPLYGRGDHAAEAGPLSAAERAALTGRALFLLLIFLPFITLGTLLLLASSPLSTRAARARRRAVEAASGSGAGAVLAVSASGNTLAHGSIASTSVASGVVPPSTAPVAVSSQHSTGVAGPDGTPGEGNPLARPGDSVVPVGLGDSWESAAWESAAVGLRRWAWWLLMGGCRRSGAAFIKWGQWAATRSDLFPQDFCDSLASLHDDAPTHSFSHTQKLVEAAFNCRLDQLFASFDPRPLASGSVAQVHRATLLQPHPALNGGRDVVVKVCHPNVALYIQQDFQILKPLARLTARVPSLRFLNLKETLEQFSHTMTAQTDLRVEAAHLQRFLANFSGVNGKVTTPKPLPELVSRNVLVESYEPGHSVSRYIKKPTAINTQVVGLGVDTFLKMLLSDNFVHTDLHPGNIMVRALNTRTGEVLDHVPDSREDQVAAGLVAQLVLLDFGLAEELTPTVRRHFISFLHCICAGNGQRAAWHILRWGATQGCPDPAAFTRDMARLFDAEVQVMSEAGVDINNVLRSVLQLARNHQVTIDSGYAALVVAVAVLVGFASSLDPEVNILDVATSCLLAHSLTGKVVGRMYVN